LYTTVLNFAYTELSIIQTVVIAMTTLIQKQFLPVSIDTAWQFFATPANLNLITPKDMQFHILSAVPEKMYEGLIINYRIKLFPLVWVNWTTEITHVKDGKYFVDEQRIGPYRIWHHEHHFKEVEGGVEMTDILHYDIGKWVFGWLAGVIFVHNKVQSIFEFRRTKLNTIFLPERQLKTA